MKEIRVECRHFVGETPCRFRRICPECPHYEEEGERILILKWGALGDVLRTTPLLRALKKEFPDSWITWVAAAEALPLLENNPLIDRLLPWCLETLVRLDAEKFHRLICLDKAPEAAAMAVRVKAERRFGFGLNEEGKLVPLNPESRYAYRLGLDDEMKFRRNRKTYQQIAFEQAGMTFAGEDYAFFLRPEEQIWAAERMNSLGLAEDQRAPIGLALGAGTAFANKTPPPEQWALLVRRISEELSVPVLLLIGPGEGHLAAAVREGLGWPTLPDSGGDHGIRKFAALIERCVAVVSGDTLAMHLALAVGTPVVALFGPTCHQEVEMYGRGRKVVSPKECGPCYRRECPVRPTCMEEVAEEEVLKALKTVLMYGRPNGSPVQGRGGASPLRGCGIDDQDNRHDPHL
jgi:heptosyltransferase-2